jgi:serine protease Do
MKRKYIAIVAAVVALPITAFTQAPPNPPNPPAPPAPPERHETMPKVPVTYLGVDTSPVPPVVCEQMSLAKGFGLVVDYVVPDSPAAAAGVQQNDILKMLNDQILLEPSQLSKLVRSYSDGTTITLTILRKGKEEKVTVKLTKKEMPQKSEFGRRHGRMDFPFGDHDFGDLGDQLNDLKGDLGDAKQGMIHDAVMTAQAAAQRVRDEAQRTRDRAQRIRDEAQRARDEARRMSQREQEAARRGDEQIRVTRTDDTGLTTTKIDVGKAQIVFSDDKGELRIDSADGKRILTAKDPQGRLLFSGPIETKEDIDKIPAEVRGRFEKLQQKDLPSVSSDENDEDNDSGDMDESDEDETSSSIIEQACVQSFPRMFWAYRTVLI